MLYEDLYRGNYNMGQYRNTANSSMAGMPNVSDPEAAFAGITRQDYLDYVKDFRGFELDLLNKTNDDSLRKRAVEDQRTQNRLSGEISVRNRERYGGAGMSNAQLQQQDKQLQIGGQLGIANTSNNARVQQRQVNDALLNELIGIGQGVNQNALSGLGDASAMAASRHAAYKNAKSQHYSNMMGLGGSMVGGAILAGLI